ncbi:hypothetical protein NEOLI_001634 [Neolecta irregularis DAH-3]|uniref:Uncharacterized protein n=1 Tax=Neolecta irregularis (strain DAH-3) TaxID=1198029 RepID=A0A1U7LLN3_NEOID|nr:hypothetical protein NEOLI_001634 [Neolecta irregularis DAH-3]|eukprot:OLL23549.1 hypothetical protein NEOLI_001634 [Neolecta irregularis DAH-3]
MSLHPYSHPASTEPSTPWPSSKCHRIIRPLKMKLTALEKSIASGNSIATVSPGKLSRDQQQNVQERHNIRKYGQKLQTRNELREIRELRVEPLLINARNEAPSPSVALAYTGTFNAFEAILKHLPRPPSNMKSLAQRSAEVVGRCIVWTAMDDVDEDEWYDSVPEQWTRSLIIGHATQLIVEKGENLKSLLPALVVLAAEYEAFDQAEILLKTLFEQTKFTIDTPGSAYYLLQLLSYHIHRPRLFKSYLQQTLTIDHIVHPALLPEILFPLSEPSLPIVVRIFEICVRRFKRKCASNAQKFDVSLSRMKAIASELVRTSFDLGGKWNQAVCYLARIILRWKNAIAESWTTPFPSVGYLLGIRAIQIDPDDPVIEYLLSHLYTHTHKSSTFRNDLRLSANVYLTKENIARLIKEMDSIKFSGLAIAIASCWQREHPDEEDFGSWIAELENKAVQLGVLSSTNKSWKWENLIQGWIEATPKKSPLLHKSIIEQSPSLLTEESSPQRNNDDGNRSVSASSSPASHLTTPRTIRKRSGLLSLPAYSSIKKPLNSASTSVKHAKHWFNIYKAQKQQTTPGMSSPLVKLKSGKSFELTDISAAKGLTEGENTSRRSQSSNLSQLERRYNNEKVDDIDSDSEIGLDSSLLSVEDSDLTARPLAITSTTCLRSTGEYTSEKLSIGADSPLTPIRRTKSANRLKRNRNSDYELDELCIPLKKRTRSLTPLTGIETNINKPRKKRKIISRDFSDDELNII